MQSLVLLFSLIRKNYWGIDDKVDSIEKGKTATLFISEGDILEIKTHNVQYTFIDRRAIDLSNKQQALYEKFIKKYDLLTDKQ